MCNFNLELSKEGTTLSLYMAVILFIADFEAIAQLQSRLSLLYSIDRRIHYFWASD